MKNRKNKRRLYQLWLQDNPYLRLTEEDRAWLDMPSIVREFDSSDYERLVKLDGGNVFLDLGFPPDEAAALKMESDQIITQRLRMKKI
ncbi:MAG: hypothetical protein Q7R66_14900 [Undibacterium sp.]|uniref:hypothetical protein n=1 Tax=Undibacterium sp. TaxID=1914977 RepID=UPI00272081AE|nr:hypothetical protein [Undibacterium sp.]MDO8653472.1 hypothetical protein [Undibacterium sp.]